MHKPCSHARTCWKPLHTHLPFARPLHSLLLVSTSRRSFVAACRPLLPLLRCCPPAALRPLAAAPPHHALRTPVVHQRPPCQLSARSGLLCCTLLLPPTWPPCCFRFRDGASCRCRPSGPVGFSCCHVLLLCPLVLCSHILPTVARTLAHALTPCLHSISAHMLSHTHTMHTSPVALSADRSGHRPAHQT